MPIRTTTLGKDRVEIRLVGTGGSARRGTATSVAVPLLRVSIAGARGWDVDRQRDGAARACCLESGAHRGDPTGVSAERFTREIKLAASRGWVRQVRRTRVVSVPPSTP